MCSNKTTIEFLLANCGYGRILARIEGILKVLKSHPRELRLHQHVDEFYYLQKRAEILTMLEKLTEASNRLVAVMNNIETNHSSVTAQYVKDLKIVSAFLESIEE